MKRFLAAVGALLVLASVGLNVWLWRDGARTSAELARYGLVREDPVLAATLDTLRRERAIGDSLRIRTAALSVQAADARARYATARAQLLASLTSAPQPQAPVARADTAPVSVVPVPVLVDSAQLTGTLQACEAAIAAGEVALRTCGERADSAEARAVRAEGAALRADTLRKAAVDSAGKAIQASRRRGLWRDIKAAAFGAGAVKLLEGLIALFGIA